MKKKTKEIISYTIIAILAIVVIYLLINPRTVNVDKVIEKEIPVHMPVNLPVPVLGRFLDTTNIMKSKHTVPEHINIIKSKNTVPEFRGPPIKQYKPNSMQQIGILTNENGEILPLYGKESTTHRDRYNYYSTVSNDGNLYPIPVTYKDRDCIENLGCQEFYGDETVSVLGKTGTYKVNVYKTNNFF